MNDQHIVHGFAVINYPNSLALQPGRDYFSYLLRLYYSYAYSCTYHCQVTTNKGKETNNALGLSDVSTQGAVIEFTQLGDRKFYRAISDGFSDSWDLVTKK